MRIVNLALATTSVFALGSVPAHAVPSSTFHGHGTIADGGAVVDATVDIERRGSKLHIHAHGDVRNYLCCAGVSPSIILSLVAKDGSTYTQIRVNIDSAPGRGWPWNGPVARGGNSDVDLAIDEQSSQSLSEVRWQFFDRDAPSPVLSIVNTAINIVVPVLLGG